MLSSLYSFGPEIKGGWREKQILEWNQKGEEVWNDQKDVYL